MSGMSAISASLSDKVLPHEVSLSGSAIDLRKSLMYIPVIWIPDYRSDTDKL